MCLAMLCPMDVGYTRGLTGHYLNLGGEEIQALYSSAVNS